MEENENTLEQVVQEIQEEAPVEFEQNNPVEEEAPVQEPVQQKSNALEDNIRLLREKSERIERERDEYKYKYEKQLAPKQEEEDYDLNLGDNDLAEGKHLSKIQRQMKAELNKQKKDLENTRNQTEMLLIEARLKAEHPDIDKVVTAENLEKLSKMDPAIAKILNDSTDFYSKAKVAHAMIKKLNIGQTNAFNSERELAQRNANKPRPLTSVSPQQAESPLSRANAFANGLTEDLKVQLRKEMDEAARNY